MRTYLAIAVTVGSGVASPTAGQAQQRSIRNGLRSELVGCYVLSADSATAGRSLYNASSSVRLDSLLSPQPGADRRSGAVRTIVRLDRPHVSAPEPYASRRPPSWRADSLSDSIRLSFIDGFSGAVFVFDAPRGRVDTLRGRAFEFWDAGGVETTHGPARAVRRSCITPPG